MASVVMRRNRKYLEAQVKVAKMCAGQPRFVVFIKVWVAVGNACDVYERKEAYTLEPVTALPVLTSTVNNLEKKVFVSFTLTSLKGNLSTLFIP